MYLSHYFCERAFVCSFLYLKQTPVTNLEIQSCRYHLISICKKQTEFDIKELIKEPPGNIQVKSCIAGRIVRCKEIFVNSEIAAKVGEAK